MVVVTKSDNLQTTASAAALELSESTVKERLIVRSLMGCMGRKLSSMLGDSMTSSCNDLSPSNWKEGWIAVMAKTANNLWCIRTF